MLRFNVMRTTRASVAFLLLAAAPQAHANPQLQPQPADLALTPHRAPVTNAISASRRTTNINQDIYGNWRLTRVLDAAAITAITDNQAKSMLGKTAQIRKDAFVFNGQACKSPTYERHIEDLAKSFREQGHVSVANMGLPDPVTAIDAGCTSIFLKKPGIIVLHWEGFYFDATRQKTRAKQP